MTPPCKVTGLSKWRTAPAATVASEALPSVAVESIQVVPLLALMASPKMTREEPPTVAVPAAAGLELRAPFMVHSVGPLTVRVEPVPARVMLSSMLPSVSMLGDVTVRVTPELMVWVVPGAVPSQSKVPTAIVEFAATVVAEYTCRVPSPVIEVMPLSVLPFR